MRENEHRLRHNHKQSLSQIYSVNRISSDLKRARAVLLAVCLGRLVHRVRIVLSKTKKGRAG